LILGRGERFFCYSKSPDQLWDLFNLQLNGYEMWPKPEADHLPLSSNAQVNTLRTGDADLRFYVTAMQDG